MSPRIPLWAEDVSRETLEQFRRYAELLLKWNPVINLVGKTTEADLWHRHIWDSYQLLPLVPRETKTVADLGSGAGLPGLILAIARPDIHVTLVERDQRKASFLREAVRHLGLNATVAAMDIALLNGRFDLVTSRALASLNELIGMAHPLLGTNAICLFPKGEHFAKEVEEAHASWVIDYRVIHSKTNEKAGIISISKLESA